MENSCLSTRGLFIILNLWNSFNSKHLDFSHLNSLHKDLLVLLFLYFTSCRVCMGLVFLFSLSKSFFDSQSCKIFWNQISPWREFVESPHPPPLHCLFRSGKNTHVRGGGFFHETFVLFCKLSLFFLNTHSFMHIHRLT